MTVQIFDLTVMDNRHIRLTGGPKQGAWQWANLDFTKSSKRNDGKNDRLVAGNRVDDIFFFIEPEGVQEPRLFIDEVVLYDAGRAS
jgi:hypothetical protein